MTLRVRLLVVVVAVVVAVTASALGVLSTQRRFLMDQVDTQLRTASIPLAQLPTFRPAGQESTLVPPAGRATELLSDLWIGEIDTAGRLVQRAAPGLSVRATPRIDASAASAGTATGRPFNVPAATGGGSFRMRAVKRTDGTTIVLGVSLDHVDQATTRLGVALALGAGGLLAIVALLVWWVWRLGLRPIRRITQTADAITAGDLENRADIAGTRSEAARLAVAFNEMLDARQRAEDRLRRFVADASHELRTPLTSVRGYATLYRRGGLSDRAALDDAMRRIGQEATRMNALVDDLLLLAQLDQGRSLACDVVDLAVIARDVATDAVAIDSCRAVQVDVVPSLLTLGDDHRLRQVVTALVANALAHTAGPVRIRGFENIDDVIIEVSDNGPGMDAEVATHAFDRFFRADASRSRGVGGAGLGLSIVQSIVIAHAGRIDLDTSPIRGTTVRIRLSPARMADRLNAAASISTADR